MKPNTLNIAGRMADFFERQIAVLDEMSAELPDLERIVEQDAVSAGVDFHKRREHALAILAREFELLKREWDETEGLTADERAHVEALSREAQKRIAGIQGLLTRSVSRAQEKMTTMEVSMTELRRGKQVMRAYKTRESGEGGGLDRQG